MAAPVPVVAVRRLAAVVRLVAAVLPAGSLRGAAGAPWPRPYAAPGWPAVLTIAAAGAPASELTAIGG